MIITVPVIVEDNTRRPQLPEGVGGYTLVEDHGDTMTVSIQTDMCKDSVSRLESPKSRKTNCFALRRACCCDLFE